MTKIIFIRGAPAVGKTTITKKILEILKKEHKLNCAYISEDYFRKQMQFKYKAKDLIVHQNSVVLIKTVIMKLLELDTYDLIFIEGQFRYKEILDDYIKFAFDNKFEYMIFQFELDIKEMKRRDIELRDSKSNDISEIKLDIDSYIPVNVIVIETKNSIDVIIKEMLIKLI